jgi:histidinol phosphatase-like PHP family hydrolase
MTKYAEVSEQDYWAASDAILMLGNVDMFYYPDLTYSYDLYGYVISKVQKRLAYIKDCLTEPAEVTPILDQMMDLCGEFQGALMLAPRHWRRSKEVAKAAELATMFIDKMSEPITKLVKTYNVQPYSRFFTEMMVRDNGTIAPVNVV